jgi:hypothetical protein
MKRSNIFVHKHQISLEEARDMTRQEESYAALEAAAAKLKRRMMHIMTQKKSSVECAL